MPPGAAVFCSSPDADQLQLIREALIAVGGIAFGHFQDLRFQPRRHLVRHPRLSPHARRSTVHASQAMYALTCGSDAISAAPARGRM